MTFKLAMIVPMALIGLMNPGVCMAAEGRPRARERLCEGWSFHLGDAAGAEKAAYDHSGWRVLDLPHDWRIEQPFDKNAPNGGSEGYLPVGVTWYRKPFVLPNTDSTTQKQGTLLLLGY